MRFLTFLLLCIASCVSAQKMQLPGGVDRDDVSFQLINNLIVVTVLVNDVPLNFLLDSGVGPTVVLASDELGLLRLNNTEEARINGIGEERKVIAWKSTDNNLRLGRASSSNHTLYLVRNADFKLGQYLGLAIHGILGSDFFSQFEVHIDYQRKRLRFYSDQSLENHCRRCESIPTQLVGSKITIPIQIGGQQLDLALDTGNSDALWIYPSARTQQVVVLSDTSDDALKAKPADEKQKGAATSIDLPHNYEQHSAKNEVEVQNHFRDPVGHGGSVTNQFSQRVRLGWGLSGYIMGEKRTIPQVRLGDDAFGPLRVSFPAPEALPLVPDYDGLLGNEILRRYYVVIDVPAGQVSLRPNKVFSQPFPLTEPPVQLVAGPSRKVMLTKSQIQDAMESTSNQLGYKVTVKMDAGLYSRRDVLVSYVLPDSPMALAGLQAGDRLLFINGKSAYVLPLYEINAMLMQPGEKVKLEYAREDQITKVTLEL